jgi:hypothetical protein
LKTKWIDFRDFQSHTLEHDVTVNAVESIFEVELGHHLISAHTGNESSSGVYSGFATSRDSDPQLCVTEMAAEFLQSVRVDAFGCQTSPIVAHGYRAQSPVFLVQSEKFSPKYKCANLGWAKAPQQ